jgi:hypothetical protein
MPTKDKIIIDISQAEIYDAGTGKFWGTLDTVNFDGDTSLVFSVKTSMHLSGMWSRLMHRKKRKCRHRHVRGVSQRPCLKQNGAAKAGRER